MDPIMPIGPNQRPHRSWVVAVLDRGRAVGRQGKILFASRRWSVMGLLAGILVVGAGAFAAANWNGFSGHQVAVPYTGAHTHRSRPAARGTMPTSSQPTSASLLLPVAGKVEANFGWVYTSHLGEWYYNPGVTLSAPTGTTVHAAWAGKVLSVGQEPLMGLTVTVQDGRGFETVYGHLGQANVKVGSWVSQGAAIGTIGGPSLYSRQTGSHLDFQLFHNGQPVNPKAYLTPSS